LPGAAFGDAAGIEFQRVAFANALAGAEADEPVVDVALAARRAACAVATSGALRSRSAVAAERSALANREDPICGTTVVAGTPGAVEAMLAEAVGEKLRVITASLDVAP
jgi:hypothetical protein